MADRVHILAVDDEQDIREILRILLESHGYAVACAANGDEAVSYMEQHPQTDLVIMDIMMPGLDGIEACARIREYSSAPMCPDPGIFLCAYFVFNGKNAGGRQSAGLRRRG